MESNHIDPKCIVSKGNVRQFVNKDEYKNLKANIKALGIGQAITVCADKDNDKQYVVIDGHQRLKIAKELKLKTIPVNYIESPNGQTEVLQHSLNVQRVSMTLHDEITMMQDLTKNKKSMKEIASMYGKSLPEVELLIQCGNVHPKILKQIDWETDDNDFLKERLAKLCLYDQSLQYEAWNNLYTDEDMLESWELKEITSELENKVFPETETKKLFTQDELDKYAKTFEGQMNTSLSLFNVSKDLSPDFFRHCFESKYPDIAEALGKLADKADEDNFTLTWNNRDKFDENDTTLAKIIAYKNPVKTLSTYKYWDGSIMYPKLIKPVKVTNEKGEELEKVKEERPKFYGQTKKFFFLLQPIVKDALDTIDPLACGEEVPRVYKWLNHDSNVTHSIGIESWEEDDIKLGATCKEIIDSVTTFWFDCAKHVDMAKVNLLFKRLEMPTIQDIVEEKWQNDDTFRYDALNCLNSANLEEIGAAKGKKSDMVQYLTDNYKKSFPFLDIFEAKDGWFSNMALTTMKK